MEEKDTTPEITDLGTVDVDSLDTGNIDQLDDDHMGFDGPEGVDA